MTANSIITTKGKNIALYRAYTETGDLSATVRLSPTKLKVGINNTTALISDTDLAYAIPIEDGTTNDDGSNTMTGSSGGDNSTDNTDTFKQGGGNSDVTAQNLIANNTATTKIWTIADLASAGSDVTATSFGALWIYIKDATALAKIVSVEWKVGSDASNYYSLTTVVANLAVGWNWLPSVVAVNALTETGTVTGAIDTFIIEIVTNNSTDTFVAGDIVYDLLRTWVASDLLSSLVSGYPMFDYSNNQVANRFRLTTVKANGFDLNGAGFFNEDTSPLLFSEDTHSADSKTDTDEFVYILKDRIL